VNELVESKVLTRKTVVEEEIGVKEEGALSCKYCGGNVEEEAGVFKCVSCGREAEVGVLKKKLVEKGAGAAEELKEFGSRLKNLTTKEFADFCLRLFTKMYGEHGLYDSLLNKPDFYAQVKVEEKINPEKELGLHMMFYDKERDAAIVQIPTQRENWRLYYCAKRQLSKGDVEDAIKIAGKVGTKLFLVSPMPLDKAAQELLEDYKEVKFLGTQDLLLLSQEQGVKLKTLASSDLS